MFQKLRNKLKEQQGMTLIELLAVIVILAIISAIAIPSILGLIDNSKKDAHVANARQMINSAKLAVSGDDSVRPTNGKSTFVTLQYLLDKGYIDTIKDPEGGTSAYTPGDSAVTTDDTSRTDIPKTGAPTAGSYVKITADSTGKLTYSVLLTDGTKSIPLTPEGSLKRSSVSQ